MRRPQRSWNNAGVFKAAQMGDPRRGRGHPGPDGRARGLGRVSARRVRGLFPFARERGHDFQPHHLFFRHWVYLGRPFTGQKGAAHGRACRRGAAGGGLLRRGLHPGGKSVVLLRCVQRACGAGLCVFVSFGHVLRAEVVCGPQGPGHGRHRRRGGRVRRGAHVSGPLSHRHLEYPHRVLGAGPSDAGGVRRGRGYFGKPGAAAPGNSEAEARRRAGTQKAAGLQRKRNAQNKPILADVRRSGACNAGRAAVQPHHRGAGTGARAFADGGAGLHRGGLGLFGGRTAFDALAQR